MLRNYLKIAWRNIVKHKAYTTINILGLALGICACLVIFLLTKYEFSFDRFHPEGDRIYCFDIGTPGNAHGMDHWNSVPAPLPDAVSREISGIQTVVPFQHFDTKVIVPKAAHKQKQFNNEEGIIITRPEYFDLFRYSWIYGDPKTSLQKPFAVVLTERKARKYFGDLPLQQMIGQPLIYEDSLVVNVTGIIKDWTQNSDLAYTDFISFPSISGSFLKNEIPLDNWGYLNHGSQAFLKLAKGVNPETVNAQFPEFIQRHLNPGKSQMLMAIRPLTSIHFHEEYGGEGRKAHLPTLYALMATAVFILILASINFVNLSTAMSVQRAKEIGIRKVFGGNRKNLRFQLLAETFLLVLFAELLAVLLVKPVLGLFSSFIPEGVAFRFSEPFLWIFLLLLSLVTTWLAGFYPAQVISGYLPVESLRGTAKGGRLGWLRKGLIVFQFAISLIFIISTLVMGNQVQFMQTQDLGFKTDAIITLRSVWQDPTNHTQVLAQKIRALPMVQSVILEAFPPMGRAHMSNGITLQGSNKPAIEASIHASNEAYIPFYRMRLLAGRNLLPSDSTREYVINESCSRALGFLEPQKALGHLLLFGGQDIAYPVVGVVADYHENSFHEQIFPVVIEHDPRVEHGIAFRLATKDKQAADVKAMMATIASQWKSLYPDVAFDYSFLNESIARLYENDRKAEWLMNTAMAITIFISCMGLFGLSMFSIEKRMKEIGIRKVLGAGIVQITTMLSKDFALLVLPALLIASPIAGYLMHHWLQGFAYRVPIGWWVYALAGLLALFISLSTVSFQAVKAALANPSKVLRTE